MFFRLLSSKSGRDLERSHDYIYEGASGRSGRWASNTSGKYVILSEKNPASAEWKKRQSVSYLYDPSQILDPFLGYEKEESAVYRPSKGESRLVIPPRGSRRKEKKVRFDLPIATVMNDEEDRKSKSAHRANDDRSVVKPTIIEAHPPSSLSARYKRDTVRDRTTRDESLGKKRLPYARHLTILTETPRYVQREYLPRAFHNGSYERLSDSRNPSLVINYSAVNRSPRRARLRQG